jgi:putative phosphoserine phosphatase/1-acylglycerol-3-phosphate O-acyltransferase
MVTPAGEEREGAVVLDPAPVVSQAVAESPIAAIFDVDNTLLPGMTSERIFIRSLYRRGLYGPRVVLRTLGTLARYAHLGPVRTLRTHRPYLRGLAASEVERLAESVFTDEILPSLSPTGIARVRDHLEQGHLVALLSGAPRFLVGLLARHLGVAQFIGAHLTLAGERYTGGLADLHPYGENKLTLARRLATEHRFDLRHAYAYADHHSDANLLLAVGHPVCVNPTPRLRRLAGQFGWPVEAWAVGKA